MALYIKLEDATSLRFSDGTPVTCVTEYLGWHAEHIVSRGIARVWNASDGVKARIEHGRWLADCQSCGCGMRTHPGWQLACCAQCGAVYRGVEFPDEIAEITRLLLERPKLENQNWFPDDPVWKLKMDNFAHRLPT